MSHTATAGENDRPLVRRHDAPVHPRDALVRPHDALVHPRDALVRPHDGMIDTNIVGDVVDLDRGDHQVTMHDIVGVEIMLVAGVAPHRIMRSADHDPETMMLMIEIMIAVPGMIQKTATVDASADLLRAAEGEKNAVETIVVSEGADVRPHFQSVLPDRNYPYLSRGELES